MQSYYFGNSLEYIEADYATNGRSACKGCKQKIHKQQLKLGLILDDDHFHANYWYHLKCFKLKPRHLEIDQNNIDEKIYNIDQLEPEDFDLVVTHIKEELNQLKNKKKGGRTDKKKMGKKDNKKESNKQNKKQTKKQTKKQSKQQSKKQQKKDSKQSDEMNEIDSDDVESGAISSESEQQFSDSQESQESFSASSDSENQKIPKKKKKSTKRLKKPVSKQVKGYTASQLQQFGKLCEKYSLMNALQLKQMLGKNRQSKNGTKQQLVQKCADGKLLGQIPTCTACGGGRLRFDYQSGIYTCPGYMEDTDFINCNKKFEFGEIKRMEWVE